MLAAALTSKAMVLPLSSRSGFIVFKFDTIIWKRSQIRDGLYHWIEAAEKDRAVTPAANERAGCFNPVAPTCNRATIWRDN
jgi:hypothetical protein